jgi:hypothetical protein
MDVGAAPPLYLHVPGVVMKAKGVDDLSRSAARARRASESTAALRRIVTSEAKERLGKAISLDLRDCRHHARPANPGAARRGCRRPRSAGPGQSRCPHCGQLHRECAFAFPPKVWRHLWPRRAQTASVVSSWSPSSRRTRRGQRSRQRPARPLSVSGTRASSCLIRRITRARGRSRRGAAPGGHGRGLQPVEPALLRGPCARHRESIASQPLHGAHDAGDRRRVAEGLFAPRPTGPKTAARWPGLVDTRTGSIFFAPARVVVTWQRSTLPFRSGWKVRTC